MKLFKTLRWPLVLATMVMLLPMACSSPSSSKNPGQKASVAENPQALRINIGSEPRTLDPAKARDLQSVTLVRMLFDGLTRINKDDKVEMALAESVTISKDKKTYTFVLRDAQWTNGDPVSAGDFMFAWLRVLNPYFPSDNAFQLYCIKNAKAIKAGTLPMDQLGVRSLDEKTLQVELEHPTPYFLELTSYPVYYAVNANIEISQPNWAENVDTYVGNGPFVLKEWKHQDLIKLEKNRFYWDQQAVSLDEISMYMLEGSTELSMFENKEIDWAGSPLSVLPIDALGKLQTEKLLNKKPILGTYFLRINTGNPLLHSQNIRKALSLSINRDALVEHALSGSQMAATGYVPEVLGLRQKSYFGGDTSHEAIKLFELGLEELSMTRAEMPELELLLASSERNQRIAQTLQETWQRVLGITVKLNGMEAKSYYEKLNQGDFQIATGSWMADYNDPISFLELFKNKTATGNQTQWENEEYGKLIEESVNVSDLAERSKLFAQCEQILMNEMPIVPIFHYNLLFVRNQKLSDVYISNLGVLDFRWAKWQTEKEAVQ